MQLFLKRWRLAVVTVAAACTLSVGFASAAFADALPGEGNSWTPEIISYGTQPLQTSDAISEAYNGPNYLMEVWRGATNSQVWMSYNHGNAFSIAGTATNVHPTVTALDSNEFAIFHVGINNQIYWTTFDASDGQLDNQWTAVPGQTTRDAVAVTQLGPNSGEMYMTYRSSTNDKVYGTLYNGTTWTDVQQIGNGALSPSAPSVSFTGPVLTVAVRGENNHIWVGSSFDQGQTWNSFTDEGGVTFDSPTITSNNLGAVLVAQRGTDNRVYYQEYNYLGNPLTDWEQETVGYQTLHPVTLAANGQIIYSLITGENGFVYWKEAWNPG